ncbi:hypothetical protein [Roseicyclus persicicus]|uniref:Uncharacterized protein n=1 Tax=Roseicyclus persicicus TaxID=2650661 RepID=A0A7X6K009_9RHOB|nr:hypothetical protein [Roseibacterium persicicum]NKX45343.1 hypothetical protein [Roseibacterium persicicum]
MDYALIDELRASAVPKGDIFLFCKCQDIRSILMAEALRAKGKRVGVDIFDDYFSQTGDMRLSHIREWMREMIARVDFLLCATDTMKARLGQMAPDLPIHRMNDPFDAFEPERVARSLVERLQRVHVTGQINVAWFGTGDNPYFPVGLDDLCDFGEVLAGFRRRGFRANLRVLTNTRAMTPARLARLGRLPLSPMIEEWTLEGEEHLLSDSFVAFLPVGSQSFSTAKSLNRAVTALTRGAQVLTVGAPIYEALEPFHYRTTDELVDDVLRGTLRLRPQVLPSLSASFARMSDPANEAAELADFLERVSPFPTPRTLDDVVIVLHGAGDGAKQHKFAQRSKMFSVASPFQTAPMNFDLKFVPDGTGEIVAVISDRMSKVLESEAQKMLRPWPSDGPITFHGLSLGAVPGLCLSMHHVAEKLAAYDLGMRTAAAILQRLIPDARIVISETTAPFQLRAPLAIPETVDA